MIENIEQAKERLKEIVDFYKLNDTDNYDYDDRVLISMKLVLEEIERLHSIIKEAREYANNIMFKTKTEEKIQDDILEILDKGE